MRAPSRGEAGILRDVVGDDGGGNLVHLKAAISFGNFNAAQAKLAGLFQQLPRNREILMLDFLRVGQDLVNGEFFRRLADELVLFGEVFRSENLIGAAGFEQEAAAGDFGAGNSGDCSHVLILEISDAEWVENPQKSTTHFNWGGVGMIGLKLGRVTGSLSETAGWSGLRCSSTSQQHVTAISG